MAPLPMANGSTPFATSSVHVLSDKSLEMKGEPSSLVTTGGLWCASTAYGGSAAGLSSKRMHTCVSCGWFVCLFVCLFTLDPAGVQGPYKGHHNQRDTYLD
jgi:hypothetical protein